MKTIVENRWGIALAFLAILIALIYNDIRTAPNCNTIQLSQSNVFTVCDRGEFIP